MELCAFGGYESRRRESPVMGSKIIYLMRHGDTGLKGRYVGSSDVPLSPLGLKQTRELCSYLNTVTLDAILCSPMLRCRQSIETLGRDDVRYHDFLKEIDFGAWEKKSFEEIAVEYRTLVDCWAKQDEKFAFPGGEAMSSFYGRIGECAQHLRNVKEKEILVVCHGGVIRHLICDLLHIPKEHYLLFDVAPGCYSTVQLFPEGGVLTGFNLKG